MVKKAIAKPKNKRARDTLGRTAEWLKEGGEEIVKSLSILFKKIERKRTKNTHIMEANNNQKYI